MQVEMAKIVATKDEQLGVVREQHAAELAKMSAQYRLVTMAANEKVRSTPPIPR